MNKALVQRLGLFAASLALSLTAVVVGSKLYAKSLNIPDPFFQYENRLDMWRSEPAIGFVNKPNFSSFGYGTVPIQTNERGFRGTRPTSVARTNGVRRIVGLGDSVMWGASVDTQDTILGFLEKKLNDKSLYEVINASTVGYATYQELLYLKHYVLPLKPDIVLVNYCDNDFLPTEDPFKNVREIYIRYLNQLLEGPDFALTAEEKLGVQEIIGIFNSTERVWPALRDLWVKSPQWLSLTRKVFIEIPVAQMAQLSREAGARLIYVFIPLKKNHATYARTADQLQKLLVEQGAEFVDVQSALAPDSNVFTIGWRTSGVLLRWVWPRELQQILKLWSIQAIHRREKFFDGSHPAKRGNAIIAEHIYRYLTETPNAREAG